MPVCNVRNSRCVTRNALAVIPYNFSVFGIERYALYANIEDHHVVDHNRRTGNAPLRVIAPQFSFPDHATSFDVEAKRLTGFAYRKYFSTRNGGRSVWPALIQLRGQRLRITVPPYLFAACNIDTVHSVSIVIITHRIGSAIADRYR